MNKIVFFASKKRREIHLAKAFLAGAKTHGYMVERRFVDDIPDVIDFKYACMVGVKSLKLWRLMESKGVTPIMFDKGYYRRRSGIAWQYWRVSVGSHHPRQEVLGLGYPSDRFERLGYNVAPDWRVGGNHILLIGSSAKYHRFYDLPDPTTFNKKIIDRLRVISDRPIFYRPKPSWKDARPISGAFFSRISRSMTQDLEDAFCVVTHGSNGCYDAALAGVPSIVLGEAVMKSISSRKLIEVERPKRGDRMPLFSAIAYQQWTLEEFRSGEAFETMKRQF